MIPSTGSSTNNTPAQVSTDDSVLYGIEFENNLQERLSADNSGAFDDDIPFAGVVWLDDTGVGSAVASTASREKSKSHSGTLAFFAATGTSTGQTSATVAASALSQASSSAGDGVAGIVAEGAEASSTSVPPF